MDRCPPATKARPLAGTGRAGEDGTVESLARLREQRMFCFRLSPDRALGSVEEADAFLRDRGLLTRTADCALPSLYEACHEDPYHPGSPGFATWPATKWPWFGELADRGHLITAVHRGKGLLVCGAVARLLDPICRAEITRMRAADRGWGRLLDHLAAAGPSSIEDLRAELGLKRQELKALRAPLERCGAIVSRSLHVTAGEEHQHSSELARWDQAYQGNGTGEDPVAAFRDLITAGRPRGRPRAGERAAALVLLAVVLDRFARGRPYRPGTAAQDRRPRHRGQPKPVTRSAMPRPAMAQNDGGILTWRRYCGARLSGAGRPRRGRAGPRQQRTFWAGR